MHKKRIFVILLTISIFIAGLFSFQKNAQAEGIDANEVVNLANKDRSENGLQTLVRNNILDRVAMNKANDMLKNDYFAHTSPKGVNPWFWFDKAGYDYKYAGENLAINFADADAQNEAWMKSETHRKNILNAGYQETGVAVVKGEVAGKTSILTVQVFGTTVAKFADLKKVVPASKEGQVAGAEKIIEPKNLVANDSSAVSYQSSVAEQGLPVSFFSNQPFAAMQIVMFGFALLLSTLLLYVVLKKLKKSPATIVQDEKLELIEAVLIFTENISLWKNLEFSGQNSGHNHSIEIRGG